MSTTLDRPIFTASPRALDYIAAIGFEGEPLRKASKRFPWDKLKVGECFTLTSKECGLGSLRTYVSVAYHCTGFHYRVFVHASPEGVDTYEVARVW